ncbi:MAG: hypothetical protein BA863_09200 [Desulfovibrio sp. S3730MH75]|nr:MAG: hypothetical protein BA863_09200 [Desulfovibrio sp. S3730MH75]
MCDIGESEPPSFCRESNPKARKQHVCCECGSTIDKGEKYQRVEGMWEGDFATFKTCMFCIEAKEKSYENGDYTRYEGIPFGQLWECIGMDYAA